MKKIENKLRFIYDRGKGGWWLPSHKRKVYLIFRDRIHLKILNLTNKYTLSYLVFRRIPSRGNSRAHKRSSYFGITRASSLEHVPRFICSGALKGEQVVGTIVRFHRDGNPLIALSFDEQFVNPRAAAYFSPFFSQIQGAIGGLEDRLV